MKRLTSTIAVAALLVAAFLTGSVQSQSPAVAPELSKAFLTELKTSNAALIERQNKTLQALEAMRKEAQQIKAFARRG